MRFLPRRSIGLVALIGSFTCMCLFGCGKGSGDVSGTVTYKGERLKGGTVTFSSASGGPSFTSPIAEDGTYTVHAVESGEYKVCVETESLKPRTAAGPSMGRGPGGKGSPPGGGGPPDVLKDFKSGKIKAGPPGGSEEPEDVRSKRGKDGFAYMADNLKRYTPIPTEYSNPDTTTLTFTATKGTQTFDIVVPGK